MKEGLARKEVAVKNVDKEEEKVKCSPKTASDSQIPSASTAGDDASKTHMVDKKGESGTKMLTKKRSSSMKPPISEPTRSKNSMLRNTPPSGSAGIQSGTDDGGK
jgi:hypothetical protein